MHDVCKCMFENDSIMRNILLFCVLVLTSQIVVAQDLNMLSASLEDENIVVDYDVTTIENLVNVYPNPFISVLNIEPNEAGNYMVMIENSKREVVFSTYFKDKIEIREGFKPGVYQVRVLGGESSYITRVVKK